VSSDIKAAFHVAWKRISRMGIFLVFRVYAGEVFGCEAVFDMLAEVFRCEVICRKLVNVICCFV
jgi:hypothetical protein